ncbi:MAG: hypothetical protein ACE144_13540 [Thermodesulfobacteriota bacterium]
MISSKYAHLLLGLLALYAISSFITYTTPFDKITENLKRYCYTNYAMQIPFFSHNSREIEFYREKFRERLDTLTRGMFHYEKVDEAQDYFMTKGYLYDSWEENGNRSHLLAKILEKGAHESQNPEGGRFEYLLLGEKKIVPFSEYEKFSGPGAFVSMGEKWIYLYKDSLEPLLRWYFESLWTTEPKEPHHFYGDALTYSLYRDLQEICQDIFIKRHYMNKRNAEETFLEEGFRVFIPTLLSMGARMAADRNNNFPSDYQYLRACLAGLSLNPNHTMFYIMKAERLHIFSPKAKKGWIAFSKRLDPTVLDNITLEQISEMSQSVLNSLEDSP